MNKTKKTIDYGKKSKENLFLIFLIGGIVGILDSGNFEIGEFIGRGFGMMLLAMGLAYILNILIEKTGTYEVNDTNDDLLDSDFNSNRLRELEEVVKAKMRPFRFGVYISLFFLLMTIFQELSRSVF